MKNSISFYLLFLGCTLIVKGQQIDYNKIILPRAATNISIEEKLVQLAWENNPEFKILGQKRDIASLNKKKVGISWLGSFGANANFNEFSLNKKTSDINGNTISGNQFYPLYNFSLKLPFSIFSNQSYDNKMAAKELEISKEEVNLSKIAVRARVLNAYDDYVRCKELFIITSKFEESESTDFLMKEQRFRSGEITLEEYNNSKKNYLDRRILKVTSQSNFNKSKIRLEEIIGVSVDGLILN